MVVVAFKNVLKPKNIFGNQRKQFVDFNPTFIGDTNSFPINLNGNIY
jgi:hypothetical protein